MVCIENKNYYSSDNVFSVIEIYGLGEDLLPTTKVF